MNNEVDLYHKIEHLINLKMSEINDKLNVIQSIIRRTEQMSRGPTMRLKESNHVPSSR